MAQVDLNLLSDADYQAFTQKRYGDLSPDAQKYLSGEGFGTVSTIIDQTGRAISDTLRGAVSLLPENDFISISPNQDLTQEQVSRMQLETNPIASVTGIVAGSILDPITLPLFLTKALKIGGAVTTGLAQGAVAGGISGAIAPVYEQLGDSRLINTAASSAFGGAIGSVLGKVLSKFGVDISAPDVEKAINELPPSAKAEVKQAIALEEQMATKPQQKPELRPFQQRMSQENIDRLTSGELDENQLRILQQKLQKNEADIARAEEELYNVEKGTTPKDAPDMMGLREPKRVEAERQTPALFKPREVEQAAPEAPRGRQVASLLQPKGLMARAAPPPQQVAALLQREKAVTTAQASSSASYLQKTIAAKQAENNNLQQILAKHQQVVEQNKLKAAPEVVTKTDTPPVADSFPTQVANDIPPTPVELGGFPVYRSGGSAGASAQAQQRAAGADLMPEAANMNAETFLNKVLDTPDIRAVVPKDAKMTSGKWENIVRRGSAELKRILDTHTTMAEYMLWQTKQKEAMSDDANAAFQLFYWDSMAKRNNIMAKASAARASGESLDSPQAIEWWQDLMYYSGVDLFFKKEGTKASKALNARRVIYEKVRAKKKINSLFPGVMC